MSIKKPHEAVKEQVAYREETLKKMILFVEGKINDHIGKYSDEDGLHKISIPMAEYRDFGWFWEDGLKEAIESSIFEAGWKIPTSKEKNKQGEMEEVYQLKPVIGSPSSISIHLLIDAPEDLDKLDDLREKELIDYNRLKALRAKHNI